MTNRVLLCIMDGWGISTGSEKYDATKLAHPVNVPELIKDYPSTKIHADGEYVGLPHGRPLKSRCRKSCLSRFIKN